MRNILKRKTLADIQSLFTKPIAELSAFAASKRDECDRYVAEAGALRAKATQANINGELAYSDALAAERFRDNLAKFLDKTI